MFSLMITRAICLIFNTVSFLPCVYRILVRFLCIVLARLHLYVVVRQAAQAQLEVLLLVILVMIVITWRWE